MLALHWASSPSSSRFPEPPAAIPFGTASPGPGAATPSWEELLVFKFFTRVVVHEALLDLGTELGPGVSPPSFPCSLFPELTAQPRNVGRYPEGMPWL